MDNNRYQVSKIMRPALGTLLETNAVLRNTYLLLALSLLFSAAMAGVAMKLNFGPISPWIFLGGALGLQFLINATATSAWGLLSVFLFTGFMGMYLGPVLNMYLHSMHNGTQLVLLALGGTGSIFLGLSAYSLFTRKDLSFLGGSLMIGSIVAIIAMLAGLFFHIPLLQVTVSGLFVLIAAGFLLWETSNIVNGGQSNYILATVSLYLSIFNLFISLLNILGFVSNRD